MDWRELPAGFELDRYIAERLGWRVELNGWKDKWNITSPDGKYRESIPEFYDPNELWIKAPIPEYSGDTNAALSLLESLTVWHITKTGPGGIIVDLWDNPVSSIAYRHDTQDIPMAICRAWLTWKDAREPAQVD